MIQNIPLGELFSISSGGTPSRKEPSYYEDGNIAWIKTGDLHVKRIFEASEYITQEGLDNSSAKLFPAGAVLVAMYGATIGACSILEIEAATNQACAAFLPNSEVDTLYLYYFLKSKKNDFVRDGVGGAQPNISATYLKMVEIPLPPLETQKQIAAVLEKADQLRKDCKLLEQELNSLAQSVFIDMFGDPVTNPKGWSVAPLSTIVDDFLGGKSLVAADDLNTKFTNRVLKISAVTSGEFKPQESKPLPNDYVPQTEHFVKVGDLLFSRANTTELVGATTMVFDEYKGLVLPDKLWRFVWKDKSLLSPIFIWQQLNEAAVRKEISKLSSGSGGSMKNISKGKLKTLPVILPPLELQQKFERVYMKLREKHGSNKQQIILSEQMFNSLMQKAFSGQLNLVNAKT
ncbi:restriction endonuclease subunit S [Shewanella baltica]|uniref:restriction endonuclease subunit S n=1 Tax=Shewanella baltica TaxID=62322 RepID=UPI00217DFC27|nr:restriction endonuclease subunit S [Shewanella baltica]MCS6129514.1 restriction endonuclease subunit S [Shewanella baltica]MCS6141480.1 restriction endonuclease subunit S [Shewanella baltica]MCS6147765.1 restriction endonuclease subunit S [Shewanella baltica]MCS6172294.1 restriction endonuclease subunit S [Shewanella baltica]MCS6189518.1 restriction endonuclease subunit S [Shewanella baltica]